MKIQFLIFLSVLVIGCQTSDNEDQHDPNEPVVINVDACLDDADQGVSVCLDSVTDDSRCPTGLVCIWEGDAVANFTIKTKIKTNAFRLHSNNGFQNDTALQGYRIKLVAITPYPSNKNPIDPNDYSAELLVTKE
ncbi:hypothetical protein K8352_08880 [Flavobacteriaceae bacterium F89]|uniref:Lipoprotein n=1 Tax=Cerina litoralis TaxID=2874477 RepID=A0AAE3JPB8_9FLAO|nr:hypothetical protein [Cerina litoralis]MCG2460861.1 hypothetical protein [Cerina litoralis]